MQELVELRRFDPANRLRLVDQALADHVDGHPQCGRGRALAHARLQQEQAALLDRELDVAHVAVVVLEDLHHFEQLGVTLGEVLRHHVELLDLADTGHDVLALGVAEEVAVGTVLPGGGVPCERDSGAGVVAFVAEHHRLDVHGGAEVVGDALEAAVVARALPVPALEHGLDRVAELLLGILREVDAGFLLDDALERLDELDEVRRRQLRVGGDSPCMAQLVELLFEQLAVDVEHDLAEHLHESPVRVVREPLVPRLLGQAADRAVVEPEVEDGVHHSRHRERRPRANRDEQRVGVVPEP